MDKIIKTHKELAQAVEGKRILHLNSLGKDSIVALEWLVSFAKPSKIYSLFLRTFAGHPDDKIYLEYLKKRYPTVQFIIGHHTSEINSVLLGIYQSPVQVNVDYNDPEKFEHTGFSMNKMIEDYRKELGCDYFCDGSSKYEDFSRRTKFHQKGLLYQNKIYPLGMMSKKQVYDLIRNLDIKLHPCYKTASSTYDAISYWKMRNSFIIKPEYFEKILKIYPLFVLDKYRYERLMKWEKKSKKSKKKPKKN